jgi:kinesin family protein 11
MRPSSVRKSQPRRSSGGVLAARRRSSFQLSPLTPSKIGNKRLSSSKANSPEKPGAEKDSNINVYVRCRARNEREVKENSGVMLSTKGINGKEVTVHGANSYNDKTYTYDNVFGPESDQEMVFNSVALNVLDEMLDGFNCTIFAYGQTGTGKTYTMAGDLDLDTKSNCSRPTEKAGIIPRVLFSLFKKLENESGEYSVKVSYIELYNEELKDLLSVNDEKKVRIYDDSSNKRSVSIQGMEEVFIRTPEHGMEVLIDGSLKRQEASTKCNDHSSRSHSVFTITVNIKQVTSDGQELVRVGKLNLVDLAGSENINRSGAENKRAREAGMINQSLLTLGRVINSLVEHSPHIPYRESKLTRILQDSLGGRTKTCIIATCSPAKASLDETLSTLEYASRAKSIKNKPTLNQKMSKQAHIMDYVSEIERLRADLNASRQKNGGIYLSDETYNKLTEESESRRILIDEQKMRLDVVEGQLQEYKEQSEHDNKKLEALNEKLSHKDKELSTKTENLEKTTSELQDTKRELEEVKRLLDRETQSKNAYKNTEKKLTDIGKELINTLEHTVNDVFSLHDKIRRTEVANTANISSVQLIQEKVSGFSASFMDNQESFSNQYEQINKDISQSLQEYFATLESKWNTVFDEMNSQISDHASKSELFIQNLDRSNEESKKVMSNMSSLRMEIKDKIEKGLSDVQQVTMSTCQQLSTDLSRLNEVIQDTHGNLGNNFQQALKIIQEQISEEKDAIDNIKGELEVRERYNKEELDRQRCFLEKYMEDERAIVEKEKDEILKRLTEMMASISERRIQGITTAISSAAAELQSIKESNTQSSNSINLSLDNVLASNDTTAKYIEKSKTKMGNMLSNSNREVADLYDVTKYHCDQLTTGIENQLANQIEGLDEKMDCLSTFVNDAEQQRESHHKTNVDALKDITSSLNTGFREFKLSLSDAKELSVNNHEFIGGQLTTVSSVVDKWTNGSKVDTQELAAYISTVECAKANNNGSTPSKTKPYSFPNELPATLISDEALLS